LAYSAGALFALVMPSFARTSLFRSTAQEKQICIVFTLIVLSILVAIPLLVIHNYTLAASSSYDSFWVAVRRAYTDQQDIPGGGGIFGVANLAPIYIAFSYIAVYELTFNPPYRRMLLLFLSLVFVFQILTTARAYVMQLLLGAIAIVAIRRDRIPIKATIAVSVLFLFLFGLFHFELKKMNADWNASGNEKIGSFFQGIAGYTAGPLVAFDRVIVNPNQVPNTWKIYKPFIRIINKFGAGMTELSRNLAFTDISPHLTTNVYTFYFTYYVDFGIVGILFVSSLFGFVSTIVFRMARSNSPLGVVLYALVVYGIVMSTFAECVCLEVTLWVKASICTICIYKLRRVKRA
jgi:oligosaccharide repeat unit polymerase